MKKYVYMFIKPISLVFCILSLVLFCGTFINEKYYLKLGKDYLSKELKEQIATLNIEYLQFVNSNEKVGGIIEKFGINQVIEKGIEKVYNNTDTIVNKMIEGGIFFGTYQLSDNTIIGKIGSKFRDKLLEYAKNIKTNFIKDIRIFFITNFVGFLIIYLMLYNHKRIDIIKKMFIPTTILFLSLVLGIIYYILGQNWIITIITNNFLGYLYPTIIIVFGLLLFFLYKKPLDT